MSRRRAPVLGFSVLGPRAAYLGHRLGYGLGLGGVSLLALGCQQADIQEIPNRVLDRPTDAVLICAEVVCEDADGDGVEDDGGACVVEPRALSLCAGEIGGCGVNDPRLIGFVANSERNEIAMFNKCDNRLVDMSPEVPGYNFIPAGVLPTELDADQDGCRVVSANVGSCDLNVLDGPALAGFALELSESDLPDELSTLVSTLVPQRFDTLDSRWEPLGARPGQLIVAPDALSTAPGNPDVALEGFCDPLARGSVYVSFPTCNLVTELDLQTGRILQSRRFSSDGQGGVLVEDAGLSPQCPIECPTQFDGALPSDAPTIDADAPFPQALELMRPDADNTDDGQSLLVGGLGSNIMFELGISDSGEWEANSRQLELSEEAGGIKNIRVSPRVAVDDQGSVDTYRFIYTVAGDGSTRVIGRELPQSEAVIGVECETQSDPALIEGGVPSYCTPVSQSPNPGQPAERRGLSRGPGIRPGRGEEVTDWMFIQTPVPQEGGEVSASSVSPFAEPGTVAVGVTNGGFGIYVMIDQIRANGATTPETLLGEATGGPSNERGVMDVRLFSHSLWPQRSDSGIPELPLVLDEEPPRVVPSGLEPTRVLAPTIRRIDAAYAENERRSESFGITSESDGLRQFYDEDVARVVVHDYRSWGSSGSSRWSLEWEATIQNTQSSTGRMSCENPGWGGGTCLSSEPGDTSVVDSGAEFCEDGVLPGDKLVMVGCRQDSNCGDGRRCLLESANSSNSGICVAEVEYDTNLAALRDYCAPFIADPCGEPVREYTVTRAFQDELWIQAKDREFRAYLRTADEERCGPNMGYNGEQRVAELDPETEELFTLESDCQCLAGFSEEACNGAGEGCCPIPGAILSGQAPVVELEDRFFCASPTIEDIDAGYPPDGACTADADCLGADGELLGICVDSQCRERCQPTLVDVPQVVRDDEGNPVLDPDTNEPLVEYINVTGDNCVEMPLPGPTCFGEFVRYQVALRDSFRVSGPGIPFITDLVDIVPVTDMDDPAYSGDVERPTLECQPTQNGEISRLLTSRLAIPRSDDPDDPQWQNIPVCSGATVGPGEANPCRIAGTSQSALYHLFEYEQSAGVSALRFTNPVFSIVLDLTSLEALSSDVPGFDDAVWPYDAAQFRRSRIPRGYRQEFGLDSGYLAFGEIIAFPNSSFPVTYPVKIIPAPQSNIAYVVDSSGPGSSTGIRGQVVRVEFGPTIDVTNAFNGVR